MRKSAEIILVRKDGAIIVQQRDDKPGIINPGLITTFGGRINADEQPIDAAVRELREETNLRLAKTDLNFFGKYRKIKSKHGEDCDVYFFVASGIDDTQLEIYEGQGFVVVKSAADLQKLRTSVLAREVLTDYFKRAAL